MTYPAATYIKSTLDKNDERVLIKANLAYNAKDNFVMSFFYILPSVLIYYWVPAQGQVLFSIKILAMVATFFLVRELIHVFATQKILKLDKQHMLTEYGLETFSVNLGDIKEVGVIEETHPEGAAEGKLYRLKYTMVNGEKTSGFAFTTYDKAEALIKIIKEASKVN